MMMWHHTVLFGTVIILLAVAISLMFMRDSTVIEESSNDFPVHWTMAPTVGTKDYIVLPGDYGYGSSTEANWILDWMMVDLVFGINSEGPWVMTRDVQVGVVSAAVQHHIPSVAIYIIPYGSPVTEDYNEDRIRIFYNPENNIVNMGTLIKRG